MDYTQILLPIRMVKCYLHSIKRSWGKPRYINEKLCYSAMEILLKNHEIRNENLRHTEIMAHVCRSHFLLEFGSKNSWKIYSFYLWAHRLNDKKINIKNVQHLL